MFAVCVVCLSGCAPAYHSVAIPITAPVTAASWRPARVGGEMRVTDTTGMRWAGTVEALGDSVVLRARYGDISHRRAFAIAQIARAQARPTAARGESTVPVILVTAVGLVSLWVWALSHMNLE